MKKKNLPQKIVSRLLYSENVIICGISEELFQDIYSPYQRAFVLRLLILDSPASFTSRQKQKIWFTQKNGIKTFIPYVEEVKQLISDSFVSIISTNNFGKTVYEITDKAKGISVVPFSKSELSILSRGMN